MEKLDFNRIHKYKQDDLMILIDINSGSLHLIDQLTWDLLDLLEENDWDAAEKTLCQSYPSEDVRDTINEVKQLIAGGQLFSDDEAVRNYLSAYGARLQFALRLLLCRYGSLRRAKKPDEFGSRQKSAGFSDQSLQAP